MPFDVLPRSTPNSQGVSPAGVERFLDAMEAEPEVELHSLMLLRNGHVVTEGWWAPYGRDRVHLLYSLSKSFVSTAAGFAVAEGLLDLDRTVLSYFGEFDAEITDERSRSILVRHVAAMASGHHAETLEQAIAGDPAEPVRGFLRIPPEHQPGTWFAYNQPCTYALAAIIQRQTGETLTEYLRPRLFDPLGIGRVGWQQYPPRRDLGFTGLHATTAAVAKLGQLYLQRGWWGDRQLLPVAWVEEATRVQVKNPLESNPDWSQGYGFQFWMARHGFRGDGAYGQFCVVLPEYDVVVAITGASHDTQAVLDGLWTHLLPALSDNHRGSPDRTAAELRLSRRMTSCELVAPAGSREPEVDGSRWDGAVFAAAGGRCGDQPTLESVRLDRVGGEWQVSLVEATTRVTGLLGNDGWHVTENADGTADRPLPIAVSGGWVEGSLGFEVLFLETPHRLRVVCSVTDGTFAASWLTVPLRSGSLLDLRMPG